MNFQFLGDHFVSLTVTGLTQGAIYALVALGYTLVYGVLRLINFAHSEVFMIGTFVTTIIWAGLGFSVGDAAPGTLGVIGLIVIAMIAAGAASGATALVVERVAYRPLRKRNAPSLIFLISAIGASVALSEAVGALTDRQPRGMPTLVVPKVQFSFLGADVTNLQLGIFFSALAMMIGLDIFINRTRLGRGVRAVAQNPDVAALMGVNKDRIIMLIFILGGAMAGAAAVLYDIKVGLTTYSVGFLLGIKAFTAAVLGGIGNLRGALLGGLLLGVVENYGAGVFGNQWMDVVAFMMLVVVLLFRPTGLLGESLGRARA
ncbi:MULTISPECIES: branched-chain amino acid ABC transporter permease [Actinoplanes]|uniref:Branched-chain amino acid ABC transporter permease n=2 Tax=Actinoplanes TaxID=1865 RepID=A0A117MM25_9ACTN|nr:MULTISPECIES: branched-chain amino acid ABC transporter permease [Actinoplanes]KUL24851.1 branched-chain amino acid ABC transporter permease [Actinoplanes awajinensis subsp. mycoplanecinus]GIE65049.1 branched-chain amino acid ABC transporter permease [Actinoplanes palleronii]